MVESRQTSKNKPPDMAAAQCTHQSSRLALVCKVLSSLLLSALCIGSNGCKREGSPGDGFDFRLGHWTVEITSRQTGKEPEIIRQEMIGRWREKGKSVETITEFAASNGKVLLLKRMVVTFDEDRSCYVDTSELSNGAKRIHHTTWDEANSAFAMKQIFPEPAKGSQSSVKATRVDKDHFTLTSERKSFGITVGSATGKKTRIGKTDNTRFEELEKKFESWLVKAQAAQKR
jgi:hypothetical protein